MIDQIEQDKMYSMNEWKIPTKEREDFLKFANAWGTFNYHGDYKWYKYSPLEANQKVTKNMGEMWEMYNDAKNNP